MKNINNMFNKSPQCFDHSFKIFWIRLKIFLKINRNQSARQKNILVNFNSFLEFRFIEKWVLPFI